MILALSICFLLMAATGYWYSRSLFSPYTLCSGMWGVVLLLFSLFGGNLLPVEGRFPLAIIIWVTLFCISAAMAEHVTGKARRRTESGPLTLPVIMVISFIASALIIAGTIKFALNYPGDFFLTLRISGTGMDKEMEKVLPNFGPLAYLSSALLPVYLVLLSGINAGRHDRKHRILFTISLILSILSAFVRMGKMSFFILFFTTVMILAENGRIKLMPLFLGSAALFILFIAIQAVREAAMGNAFEISSFFDTYLFSGVVAFDSADLEINWSSYNSLRFLHAIASSFGVETQVNDTILGYTMAGRDTITNVYTVLYPFYVDFGHAGIGIFALISGALAGFIYKKSRDHDGCKALYAIIASYIVLQFTGEFIFTNASLFIQHCLYCWALYLPIELKILERHD